VLEKAAAKQPYQGFQQRIYLFDCDPAKTVNFTKPNPFFLNTPTWH
jgi:hypothetical protein